MPESTADPAPPYDRAAIFNQSGPLNPSFMREAIRTLLRSLPLDPAEPQGWQDRRMNAALLGLAALNPRDEIEVMLAVQAMAAYHAATACWHIGMNHHRPNGDSTRHITSAATAARTFDTMLRALERRQAKPLFVPPGRPPARTWDDPHPTGIIKELAERCRLDEAPPESADRDETPVIWTSEDLAVADTHIDRERTEAENDGLDIANTEGIRLHGPPSGPHVPPRARGGPAQRHHHDAQDPRYTSRRSDPMNQTAPNRHPIIKPPHPRTTRSPRPTESYNLQASPSHPPPRRSRTARVRRSPPSSAMKDRRCPRPRM